MDSDLLRFDFYADRLLTQEEIAKIEKRVNQIIYMSCDVKIEEMIYCTIDKDEIELLLNQLNKEYKNDIKQKNKEKNRELQYV